MKPNVPKRSFTPAAFNVQSDVSMVNGKLLRSSVPNTVPNTVGATGLGGATIVTLSICVDGVPKSLDVYAAGPIY